MEQVKNVLGFLESPMLIAVNSVLLWVSGCVIQDFLPCNPLEVKGVHSHIVSLANLVHFPLLLR